MKCPNCGYENGENSKFCLKCGTKLVREQVSATVNEDVTIHETDIDEALNTEQFSEVRSDRSFAPEIDSDKTNNLAPLVYTHKVNFFKENKIKILIIAGLAAVVAMVGGCIAWDSYRQNNILPEVKSTPTYAEYFKNENKDEESKETSAETSVQSQTQTTVSVFEVTENDSDSYDDYRRQSMRFELNGATIVFEPNEEYYVSDGFCTSYLSYSPRVTITFKPDVANKIENSLAKLLSFDDLTSKEYGTKTTKRPEATFGDMSYQNFIIDMYEENGLLFASINTVSDMGGGMSTSIYGEMKTRVYDLSDGCEFELDDFVKDKTKFLNAVDSFICDLIYDKTYINPDNGGDYGIEYDYTLEESVSYDDFVEEVKRNPWYNSEWTYDGDYLWVKYNYLLGMSWVHKDTGFYIPKTVWSDYVDFSVGTSSKNTDGALRDALGCKIMSGNTAANYANYTGYCFDEEYIYYAGGEDGYHWQLRKNIIGGSGLDGELISDDMTDAVMVYGDRIYYRNASDGYKLYSINKNGMDKKALTDAKASAIRLYDGKIYFTSDGKLFRMDMDGNNKEKIFERGCYDLQIYDNRIYTASEDSSCIYIYDLSGTYQGSICSSYTPTIKWFFVSYGNCVMANENSISIVDVSTFSGVSYTEMNIKGISENKNDYLFVEEVAGRERVICISKKNIESDSFYDFINGVNNREFYVIYDDYNTYIYTFDKDGVVTSEVLGDY